MSSNAPTEANLRLQWVKICIPAIWLNQSRMVMVAFEHTLPVHMTGFMAIESEKRRPK